MPKGKSYIPRVHLLAACELGLGVAAHYNLTNSPFAEDLRTGASKDFGSVEFPSEDEAAAASEVEDLMCVVRLSMVKA